MKIVMIIGFVFLILSCSLFMEPLFDHLNEQMAKEEDTATVIIVPHWPWDED